MRPATQHGSSVNVHRQLADFAFVAPRFHTNQVNFVRYLQASGHFVAFFVASIGVIEWHEDLTPTPIRYYNEKSVTRLRPRFRNNPYFELYKFGLMTLETLVEMYRTPAGCVIIRTPVSLTGLLASVVFRLKRAKIVFYTQSELHRRQRPIKDCLLDFYARIFGATWITPCQGDTTLPRPLRQSLLVPFTARPSPRPKTWFKDERINIIMIGKFLPRKMHELLLDALEAVAHNHQVRLTLIGELSDVTGGCVFESVQRKALTSSFPINILTNLPYEKVLEQYQEHDLFILPSIDEPASISNLEAMSFGLPVIVSDCNQTRHYSKHGGWTFKSGSVADLSATLKEALSDRQRLIDLGRRNLERVAAEFTPEIVYDELVRSLKIASPAPGSERHTKRRHG
jgi:glycosyltransferase involved in cell wall biosynthesis